MKPTRRLFLQRAALSAFVVNFPLSAFTQKLLGSPDKGFDPENLAIFNGVSRQTFEPWIGSLFRVSLNNKPLGSIVLVSVDGPDKEPKKEWGTPEAERAVTFPSRPAKGPQTICFSLHFQGSGAGLPQETYTLSHDWLGTFPLFLVPSGLPGPGPTYTAVFTLLNQSGAEKAE